ncbi:MAG: bifunctional folylpolyglutamate synthase/dihydrofolate synthase [Deltaproteobacteria bacterium]|nr:bifunctional folylpolyglutamate synthase/dihydrofolate synthase [Candidatus Zymogenaceae bacterium]
MTTREHPTEEMITEAFRFLEGLAARGMRTDLSVMRRAAALLGDPQDTIPVILVGGTNGKGSTAAYLGGMLTALGMKAGCYYSPHVTSVTERVTVNGREITRAETAALIMELRASRAEGLSPTYFEFLTLLAYLHFSRKNVDYAVMEVGMGGRFDATNIVNPMVSVITTVSLDHTQYLGETEAAIAGEKAEIIPPGGRLAAGRVSDEAKAVLIKRAKEHNAVARFFGEDFFMEEGAGGVLTYRGVKRTVTGIRTGLFGRHQGENAATAIAALEYLEESLGERGVTILDEAIRAGLREARLPGRIQVISERPEVIVDVAHNRAAAKALAAYMGTLPEKPTALVLGMMADKDIEGVMEELVGIADRFFLARPDVERAAGTDTLGQAAKGLGAVYSHHASVADALNAAREWAGEGGRVLVTGSFHTVEEAVGDTTL